MSRLSHTIRSTALALLAVSATGASTHGQSTDSARIAAAVDSIAAASVATGRIAGMSVAVSLAGKHIVTKGYGQAVLEWKVPTPQRAIYAIGSVTKQFTAAAILQLVEEGKVDLDAELTTYLPTFDTKGRRVTVRRLLDHTSGITSYTSMPEFRDLQTKDLPRDTLLALVQSKPFVFEPGAMEVYNNSGFFLLGLIIEKVSGRSYADYVKTRLFDRAGMRDSRYCSGTEVIPSMTQGYDFRDGALRRAAQINHTWPYAAGSLCSTVADLDRWNQSLHNGRILGPAAYRELITPGTLNDGSRLRYAKGIAVSDIGGQPAIHHGGDIDGFATYLTYFPQQRLSIAVAINSQSDVRPSAVVESIARVVTGGPARTAAFRGNATDYVGEYRGVGGMGEDLRLRVVADADGRLTMPGSPFAPPGAPATLAYVGDDAFDLNGTRISFAREQGKVRRLQVDAVYAFLVLRREQ
jgi:CubicO group peptidase (beta-lactamase class C family)